MITKSNNMYSLNWFQDWKTLIVAPLIKTYSPEKSSKINNPTSTLIPDSRALQLSRFKIFGHFEAELIFQYAMFLTLITLL